MRESLLAGPTQTVSVSKLVSRSEQQMPQGRRLNRRREYNASI